MSLGGPVRTGNPAPRRRMFNSKEPFRVEIQSGGLRVCRVNFPSDDKWIQRALKQKLLRIDIGAARSRTDVTPIEPFDNALFKELLIEDPQQEFDEYEASLVIDTLAKANLVGQEQDAAKITIKLAVFGGVETVHVLRHPRRRQVVEYGREAVKVENVPRGAETKLSIEPSGRLYDQLLEGREGYAEESAVPIVHKDAVIAVVIRAQTPEA